ncbi:hypothetical protein [Rothia uropygialis]|uniref:hypothetical protein n=1 Tax=Kocuria sp. 36 TaxID=1415402 RepID=UPI0018772EF7|nr:hypothetical protein [Kocuria sp. 36]
MCRKALHHGGQQLAASTTKAASEELDKRELAERAAPVRGGGVEVRMSSELRRERVDTIEESPANNVRKNLGDNVFFNARTNICRAGGRRTSISTLASRSDQSFANY